MKFNSYMSKSYKPISRTSINATDKAFKNLRVLLKSRNDPIRFGGPMHRISLYKWWFSHRSPITYYTQNDSFSDLYSTAVHIGDMQYISEPFDF